MSPDDPRHGTAAGCRRHYRDGEKPCTPCLTANRRATIIQRLHPPKRSSLGSQRRLRALQAIGYSRERISRELGYAGDGSFHRVLTSDSVLATTERRICEVYDRLCMVIPNSPGATRARNWAARHGYFPPLAWEDIDDPNETPDLTTIAGDLDPVVVMRLLQGDRVTATRAEKDAAMAQWIDQGGVQAELCRWHGWKQGRYGTGLRLVEDAS